MAIDPSFMDAGVKFGHHLHDHHEEEAGRTGDLYTDTPDLKNKANVNPREYAFSKAASAALTGGTVLALFGTLYFGIKWAMSNILTSLAHDSLLIALPAAALTGALWYGGKAFMQAYGDANEHNEKVSERIKRGLGIGKDRELEQEVTVSLGKARTIPELDASAAPFPAGLNDPLAVAALPIVEEALKQRPAYLANILEKGPKSLSAADISARLAEERATGMEATRT